MTNFENKILKKKKLDKELTLKVTQNGMSGRIFVEFSSETGKMVLQKSFQNTYEGKKESESFQKSVKSIGDLKKYFGIISKTIKIEKVIEVNLNNKGLVIKEKKNVIK